MDDLDLELPLVRRCDHRRPLGERAVTLVLRICCGGAQLLELEPSCETAPARVDGAGQE
jgi:hypothetical protein